MPVLMAVLQIVVGPDGFYVVDKHHRCLGCVKWRVERADGDGEGIACHLLLAALTSRGQAAQGAHPDEGQSDALHGGGQPIRAGGGGVPEVPFRQQLRMEQRLQGAEPDGSVAPPRLICRYATLPFVVGIVVRRIARYRCCQWC